MHFATLASGSSGNATVVGEGNRNFLVDCGITVKRLIASLEMLHIRSSQLEGIILTHEHIDHIKGVGALARKLKIPVYATAEIWEAMAGKFGELLPEQKICATDRLSLADMKIQLVPTSHDSRESYALKVEGRKHTLAIATDSGTITEEMHRNLQGCDGYIVEANYDPERLRQGRYPWILKKRIASDRGHLSNIQLAEALKAWLSENTQKVVLAHLSEENNTPQLALSTVVGVLRDAETRRRYTQLKIRVAPRHSPHELIILEE